MGIGIFFVCQNCSVKHRNYRSSKSKKLKEKKMNLNKYCNFCLKTQPHKEEIIK